MFVRALVSPQCRPLCLRSSLSRSRSPSARALIARQKSLSATAVSLEDGKKVRVTWEDGLSSNFHARWLRHNCRCPACWNSDSCQKIMSHRELQGVTIDHVQVNGDQVCLQWTSGDGLSHRGNLKVDWLRNHDYSEETLSTLVESSRPNKTESLPRVTYEQLQTSQTGLWEWLSVLNECGVCLLTGVPADNHKVLEVASLIGPVVHTHYGTVFNVQSEPNAINLASTTSYLPLHVDLAYLETPPGVQLLHCLRNDPQVEGGESILLDGWAVAESMRITHPDLFKILTEIPATFDKVQPNRNNIRHRKPHITLDRDGEIVAINWSPQNHGPLFIHEDEVEPYYRAYNVLASLLEESEDKIFHLLRPGEVLGFNNRRFLHSRNEYFSNGGTRHLQGAYVSSDDFKSKVKLLAEELCPGHVVKAIMNRCSY